MHMFWNIGIDSDSLYARRPSLYCTFYILKQIQRHQKIFTISHRKIAKLTSVSIRWWCHAYTVPHLQVLLQDIEVYFYVHYLSVFGTVQIHKFSTCVITFSLSHERMCKVLFLNWMSQIPQSCTSTAKKWTIELSGLFYGFRRISDFWFMDSIFPPYFILQLKFMNALSIAWCKQNKVIYFHMGNIVGCACSDIF